jgi:hypothetical protein
MTAGEFFAFPEGNLGPSFPQESRPRRQVPPLVPVAEGETRPVLTGEYLGTLFRCFDRLRFSGEGIEKEAVLGILDGVKLFTDTLGQSVQSTATVQKMPQTVPDTISATGGASAQGAER